MVGEARQAGLPKPHGPMEFNSMYLFRLRGITSAVAILFFGFQGCGHHAAQVAAHSKVQPALLVWQTDIHADDGPSPLLETITSVLTEGHRIWRITHYPPDPTTSTVNEFDLYDVDAESFQPIRSVMQTPEFRLEITFAPDAATLRRVDKDGSSVERIPLSKPVMPEGPGSTVFLAGLPLKEGFTTEFLVLDRWSGTGSSRVKTVKLSVIERKRISTASGSKEVFEVEARAIDDSFRIVEYVRTRPPYYPFRVEYTRGSHTMVSDVVTMIFGFEDE
jgi:hypothetical protein